MPTYAEMIQGSPMHPQERREIRAAAVREAVYLHGEISTFEREEGMAEVLKSAQDLYDWITEEG